MEFIDQAHGGAAGWSVICTAREPERARRAPVTAAQTVQRLPPFL